VRTAEPENSRGRQNKERRAAGDVPRWSAESMGFWWFSAWSRQGREHLLFFYFPAWADKWAISPHQQVHYVISTSSPTAIPTGQKWYQFLINSHLMCFFFAKNLIKYGEFLFQKRKMVIFSKFQL
jgi:hypothetical protein